MPATEHATLQRTAYLLGGKTPIRGGRQVGRERSVGTPGLVHRCFTPIPLNLRCTRPMLFFVGHFGKTGRAGIIRRSG